MLKVFLNHTAEDKALVTPYFHKLKALGFEPWIDKRILPGQDWDEVIQRAFNAGLSDLHDPTQCQQAWLCPAGNQ